MLGDLHLGPGAQPGRRQQGHQRGGRAEHDRGLRHARRIARVPAGDLRREQCRADIGGDRGRDEQPHRDVVRQRQAAPVGLQRHGDEHGGGGQGKAADHHHRGRRAPAPVCRRDQQVEPPDGGDRRCDQHDPPAFPLAPHEGELVDEDQPADRRQHARDQSQVGERRQRRRRERQRFQQRAPDRQRADRRGRRVERIHRRHAGAGPPDQYQHRREPDEVAQRLYDARDEVGFADPRHRQRPQRRHRQRRDQHATVQADRRRPTRPGERQCRKTKRGERMPPEDQHHHDASARPTATGSRATSATGSAGRGTANSSWHNRGRIRACGAHPRSTRHRDS